MFGDMLGDLQKKQDELKSKLSTVELKESLNDDAIIVTINAARELVNIELDDTKIDMSDKAEVEDLVLIAVNNALKKAADKEAEMSQGLISSMLPPGMENMFGS